MIEDEKQIMWNKIVRLELENEDLRTRINAISTFLIMRYTDDHGWIKGSGMVENNND